MQKVLIIGGSGYIGSRLTLDYKGSCNLKRVDLGWYGLYSDDNIVEDYRNLTTEFIQSFDSIILLAGHSSVKMCEGNFNSAYKNNVENFIGLINKMTNKQKLIYASSSSVYGMVGSSKVAEDYTDFIPYNDYDVTKHFIDVISQRSDIEFYGLRFGTVNGFSPRVRSDIMINSMTYSAINNKEIKLYIKDITRPILGINDLSRAIFKIVENKDPSLKGIYNLASFSNTAENIALGVSKVTNAEVINYDSDPNNIKNVKLETKCYDFDIDCNKFITNFNFKFNETIETIALSILENFEDYGVIEFTNRSEQKKYE